MPAGQAVHVATADTVEYLPALHSLHELAPPSMPVFVTEPGVHGVHAATSDALEYSPAAHAVHDDAPD